MTWKELVVSVCGTFMSENLDTYILNVSERYGVDKEITLSVVHTESRCFKDAVGNSGELGLMQVTPRWHMERAKNLGVEDLLDPYSNILVGVSLLKDLDVNENPIQALEIYNGGYVKSAAATRYANNVYSKSETYKQLLVHR